MCNHMEPLASKTPEQQRNLRIIHPQKTCIKQALDQSGALRRKMLNHSCGEKTRNTLLLPGLHEKVLGAQWFSPCHGEVSLRVITAASSPSA